MAVVIASALDKDIAGAPLFRDVSFKLERRDRMTLAGRNGAGKTTLLKMVAGALRPDSGEVVLGASLKLGYFAQQSLDLLNPDLTLIEQLQHDFPQDGLGVLRNLLGAFQFSGDETDKKIRVLSGGERTRLVLARMLYDPPNFLVLDEPTNHLDIATKEMLIDALGRYEGTMLFVSHDRHFLSALSNRVLELTPEGVQQYGGGYTEYVARTGQEAPGLRS